jgi:hypothetical protein
MALALCVVNPAFLIEGKRTLQRRTNDLSAGWKRDARIAWRNK